MTTFPINYQDGYRAGFLDGTLGYDLRTVHTPNLPGYSEGYTDGYTARQGGQPIPQAWPQGRV